MPKKKDNRIQWAILIALLAILGAVITWNLLHSSGASGHRIPIIDEVLRRKGARS